MRIFRYSAIALLGLALFAAGSSDAREIIRFSGYSAGTVVVRKASDDCMTLSVTGKRSAIR